jgi:hypothetical protein
MVCLGSSQLWPRVTAGLCLQAVGNCLGGDPELDWRLGEANIEPSVCESGRQNLAPLVLGFFSEAPIAESKSSSTSNRDADVHVVRASLRPSGEWARRLHFSPSLGSARLRVEKSS